jgi:hypothetical protein
MTAPFRAFVVNQSADGFTMGIQQLEQRDLPPGDVLIRVAYAILTRVLLSVKVQLKFCRRIAVFSRSLSRCYPLMYRPAVLHVCCTDETWSAQRAVCVPSSLLLPLCKEEVENWRQRTRHSSVLLDYLYNCSI